MTIAEDAHYCEIEVGVAAYKLLCEIALQKQLGPSTVNLGNHGLILIQNAYNLKRLVLQCAMVSVLLHFIVFTYNV